MSATLPAGRKLETRMVEKVWGCTRLPAPFAAPEGQRIGEIWFEPPPELDALLVKYLFTSEKLSVQDHPSDEEAQKRGLPRGKDECWLILRAEPDSTIAIGPKAPMTADALRASALDGSIEDRLDWKPVKAGDFFYSHSGVIHAIGAGLVLIEVQQNSDTTFRLYDYGRPRELHLERGLAVAKGEPYRAGHKRSVADGAVLVDGPLFRFERVEGAPDAASCAAYAGPVLALPLAGEVVSSDGSARAGAGECLVADSLEALDFSAADVTLLVRAL